MKRDKLPLSPAPSALSTASPEVRACVRQLDVLGWPASALLDNFLPTDGAALDPTDAGSDPLAIIDRCLSSWITHLVEIDRQEAGHVGDEAWERVRDERRLALEQLRRLHHHLLGPSSATLIESSTSQSSLRDSTR